MTDYLVKKTQYGTNEFYDPLEETDEPIAAINDGETYSGREIVAWLQQNFGFDIHVEDVVV